MSQLTRRAAIFDRSEKKIISLVEDFEYQVLYSDSKEVENVPDQQRPRRPSLLTDRPEKLKPSGGHRGVAFCSAIVKSSSVMIQQIRDQGGHVYF